MCRFLTIYGLTNVRKGDGSKHKSSTGKLAGTLNPPALQSFNGRIRHPDVQGKIRSGPELVRPKHVGIASASLLIFRRA